MTFNFEYAHSHRRIGITTRKYNRVIYLKWHGFHKSIRLWPTQHRLWLRFSWLWPEKMKTAPVRMSVIGAWRQNVKRGTFADSAVTFKNLSRTGADRDAFDARIAELITLAPAASTANYEPKLLPKSN